MSEPTGGAAAPEHLDPPAEPELPAKPELVKAPPAEAEAEPAKAAEAEPTKAEPEAANAAEPEATKAAEPEPPKPPPVIAGTEPALLSVKGGVLTILGAGFADGCRVRVGDKLVPVSWVHGGRVEAVLHNFPAGEADLVVENPDGQRAVRERALRFTEPPVVGSVAPDEALTTGGATLRVLGKGFDVGCVVLVAGAAVPGVVRESDGVLVIVAPAHPTAEAVDVAVVNPSGLMHRLPGCIVYRRAPPHVDSVNPSSGTNAGGTRLSVRGRAFDPGCSAYVCGIRAKVTFKSPEEIEVETPPVSRDGLVEVRVVNPDDQAHTLDRAFRYEAPLPPPVLRAVSPAKGSQAGGLKVAVLGDDFVQGVTVRFGDADASVRFLTRKELEVTTPPYARACTVDVEVKNPDGAFVVLDAAFVYEGRPSPNITGITPNSGPTTGGTKVTVEGLNFTRDCQVYIGREPPKDQLVKSAGAIQIITPPRKMAGVVDVEVVAPGSPKAVMKNGYRYAETPGPVIGSVSPNAGTVGGGTEMTILGKNFVKDAVVLVDGKPGKGVKLVDEKTLELRTPPGEPGKMADVVVRHPDGKEAVQKRAFLYDPRYR